MRTQALATEFDFTAVDSPNGVNLGNWRAVELLGSGGTAEVWRAVAPDGREAALKLVKRELRRRPGANASRTTVPQCSCSSTYRMAISCRWSARRRANGCQHSVPS